MPPLSDWFLREVDPAPRVPNAYLRRQSECRLERVRTVQSALTELGQLANPLLHGAERAADWVIEVGWVYRTELSVLPEAQTMRYCALGPHSVWLNGECIAEDQESTEPLSVLLAAGAEGLLEWRFAALGPKARARRADYFTAEGLPHQTPCFDERCFLVYPPFLWGWDWGPCLPLVGLVAEPEFLAHIVEWPILKQHHENGRVTLTAEDAADFELLDPFGQLINPVHPGNWSIEDPLLWWPNGYGPPNLYRLRHRATGASRPVGLRTISLDPDAFQFVVNGQPIWARGANWTPMSVDPEETPPGEIRKRVQAWADINANMLRVWGGQAGECDEFYEACDVHGILVWQDFLSACHYLPDDEAWTTRWHHEAAQLHQRIAWHPCLALWCGNNEAHQMHHQRWAGELTPPRFHGEALYHHAFASLPMREPYIPTSPLDITGNGIGDRHYWDVWHGRGDWQGADLGGIRFASEFGFASLPEAGPGYDVASLFGHHNCTGKSREMICDLVRLHYAEPADEEGWVLATQLNQRDALRAMIESLLAHKDCHGALIWQANDCWPALSWSVIDWLGKPKLAFDELKRLFQPAVVIIHDGHWMLVHHCGKPLTLRLEQFNEDGALIQEQTFEAKHRELIPMPLEPHSRCSIVGRPETGRWHLQSGP